MSKPARSAGPRVLPHQSLSPRRSAAGARSARPNPQLYLVPGVGVEPTRVLPHQSLSPPPQCGGRGVAPDRILSCTWYLGSESNRHGVLPHQSLSPRRSAAGARSARPNPQLYLVPGVGVEPTRVLPHQSLSLARLPISPPRHRTWPFVATGDGTGPAFCRNTQSVDKRSDGSALRGLW